MNLLVILASKFPVTVQFWCRYNRMHHRTRSQGAPLAPVPRPLRLNTIIVVNILDHNIVLSASLLYHLINMTRLGQRWAVGWRLEELASLERSNQFFPPRPREGDPSTHQELMIISVKFEAQCCTFFFDRVTIVGGPESQWKAQYLIFEKLREEVNNLY